jgi:DNA-binding beta-propeller fold protein YncE
MAERWALWRGALLTLALVVPPGAGIAQTAEPPLVLEAKIPLGEVSGRIDHLAIDLKRQRLFVAELGNYSLGVVDLAARKVLQTIAGLSEPQGVGYEPASDTVYVANAGDGSVRLLRGDDLAPIGRIELGDDADNVRLDAPRRRVVIGYGKGALALIDPASRTKTGDIRLPGHPESFQIAENGTQIFVNVPDFRQIAIVDLASAAVRSVPTEDLRSNFPMAIDPAAHRVLVAFRSPPTLLALTSPEGRVAARLATCGDADDVFVDARRRRIYVSCGAGAVDVIEPRQAGYARVAQVPTVAGARTALFVPELDRLFVAVRASSGEPAAIWVFRPSP